MYSKNLNVLKNANKLTRFVSMNASMQSSTGVIPIDDLNRTKKTKTEEDYERCKLASIYRLVDLKGWSMNIYNHITLRSPKNADHFFINPFGLFYHEITASSLLKVDSKCNVIEKGSTSYGLNKPGFILHSTIHQGRPDINAVIHIHTGLGAALASLKYGFLPISQESLIVSPISYHDYYGVELEPHMRATLIRDLGPTNKIMAMRNHGIVVCGSSIEEAWGLLSTLMVAAQVQFCAMATSNGLQNIVMPEKSIIDQVQQVVIQRKNLTEKSNDGIEWKFGEMETEGEMRKLDLFGYKTGYPYKKPPPAHAKS